MAYSRHQSFYIKNNWINKGIKAIQADPQIFASAINYQLIGVGKNMFFSMKYWLEALNIIRFENDNAILTDFGEFIRDNDLSCDLNITLNLLHFYLVQEKPLNGAEISSSFYWFFNKYQEKIFRKNEVTDELIKWDTINFHRNTSENTISRDIDCLFQTYTKCDKLHPEDKNISVLSKMHLISKQRDGYIKLPIKTSIIDRDFFMYLIIYLIEKNSKTNMYIDLNTLESCDLSPGRIFNMSRLDIIEVIEDMIVIGYPIEITRTNNLDTVQINVEISASQYITEVLRKRDI